MHSDSVIEKKRLRAARLELHENQKLDSRGILGYLQQRKKIIENDLPPGKSVIEN